jgi:hypothetical protein
VLLFVIGKRRRHKWIYLDSSMHNNIDLTMNK